jgi:hypothetical protein
MMTSAGEVFVCLVFAAASELLPMRDLPILRMISIIHHGLRCTYNHVPHNALEHTAGITSNESACDNDEPDRNLPEVAQPSTHEPLSSFSQKIWLLDLSFGRVDVW